LAIPVKYDSSTWRTWHFYLLLGQSIKSSGGNCSCGVGSNVLDYYKFLFGGRELSISSCQTNKKCVKCIVCFFKYLLFLILDFSGGSLLEVVYFKKDEQLHFLEK
jgi:hypothetical protein